MTEVGLGRAEPPWVLDGAAQCSSPGTPSSGGGAAPPVLGWTLLKPTRNSLFLWNFNWLPEEMLAAKPSSSYVGGLQMP